MSRNTGPIWLEPTGKHKGGVNHLGLRRPGLYMADALLPGFTNTTNQARYYSVIAFMYAHAQDTEHLRLIESAYVHAIRRHEHVDGVRPSHVGAVSVPHGDDKKLPLTRSKRIVSALDAPFYGPSAWTLGVAGRSISGKHESSKLARDIAKTISVDPSCLPKPGRKTVKASSVDDLCPLCLCIPPKGRERSLLEELFFRIDRPRAEEIERKKDGPRRRSMALLLHALVRTDRASPYILQRFLDSHLGRIDYKPPDMLTEEAFGFAGMALRWFFRHALETIWAGFGRLISRYGPLGTDMVPYVDQTLSEAKGMGPWNPETKRTVGSIATDLENSPERELNGMDEINELIDETPEQAILAAAVQLAGIADVIQHFTDINRFYHRFASWGDPYWVSMTGFRGQADPDLSLRDWLAHLFSRYAIAQHFITGAIKWQNGIDGYFFHPEEQGYILDPPGRKWWPDPGRTKIRSALNIMKGLGLVNEKDGIFSTTERGFQVVEKVCSISSS